MDDTESIGRMNPDTNDTTIESRSQSQSAEPAIDKSSLWGYLKPCGKGPSHILFSKAIVRWSLGRKPDNNINLVVLDSLRISSQHCIITYRGNNRVTVLDMSLNGTWINGEKIGRGNTEELHDGDEICLGTTAPYPQNGGVEDYRYIYCHTADGTVNSNIYDNYEIGPELGRGAFSQVHEATHKATKLPFAVKVISEHDKNTSRIRSKQVGKIAYIQREMEIMKQLEHPNICKLMQNYIDENLIIYLILERINGGDLLGLVNSKGRLSERHAKDIIFQVCDAMVYMHAQGIVHRDLKLENILVTEEDHPIAKVADFGIARLVDNLTMLRTRCGTPSYIAPEIDDPFHVGGYDNKVDSWCMGVIVYTTLTGVQPFLDLGNDNFSARKVDWKTFTTTRGCSMEAVYFVQELLQKDPRVRLSLSKAHHHLWLRNHTPYHHGIAGLYRANDNAQDSAIPGAFVEHNEDAQLVDRVSMEEILASSAVGPSRPRVPLQRRIEVLESAAASGIPIRQPSLQMIINVSRQTRSSAAGPSTPSNGKGRNKRPSAIPPIPEEEEPQSESSGDVEMTAASPVKTPRPIRKKAKVASVSPKKAPVNRGAAEDVPMESPVKAPVGSARSTAAPSSVIRYSSRVRKMNDRR